MNIEEELIIKEKELLLPETRHSIKKLKELISKEFIEIGSSGRKFGFNEVLEELPNEQNFRVEISDIEFRMIDDDVAQIFYIAKIVCGTENTGNYSRRNSIWRNNSGEWKMVFHQGTRMQ